MPWKEIVGARFSPAEFDDYVAQLDFSAWRPQFVVVHNTGIPTLANKPVGYSLSDMPNLVHFYRDTMGWRAGPHCFVDQNGIWVFTPLTTSGRHSPSWNEVSWGVETLGDYSTETFTDPIQEHLVACLATLHTVIPLDVSNLRFHKEDLLTDHPCPGVNMNKVALIHDVRQLILSRHTLANPASGRYTGDSPADLSPKSHFFVDHTAVDVQTDDITFGPVSSATPADKENKFRVTSLFKANTDVKAYAVVSGTVMLQRVADAANPGSYRPHVVNLVIQPYEQPMPGFTPVKYFIYRNLRLDNFLADASPADEKLVRAKANASTFIQNQWAVHTAWNGAVPFESAKLGYDPSNQPGTAKIDGLFYRQNPNEQLPFVARGDYIGDFYANAGQDPFGIEIVLEGDLQPDYNYVRTYKEVIIDVSAIGVVTVYSVRLEREKILNYIDPAAFFGLHMVDKGWLQVKDGVGKKKLAGVEVYDQVISKFATRNTVYVDIRNENGRSLNFYGAYNDGSGNALSVGDTTGFAAQPYGSGKWPLIIRKLAAGPSTSDHSELKLIFIPAYNRKPILYLEHGQASRRTTKGRFIAGADLIGPGATTTEAIGFRYPNKDLGAGSRIGVAWLFKMDYTMRQDAANVPFPSSVVPTESYLDNLFGPIDIEPPWAVSSPVIAWVTAPDKKYVDGDGVAGLGFEHIVERGVAFSKWTPSSSTAGNVLFFAAAKDTFVNLNKKFVSPGSLASGVSNRDSFFEEPMLFDGYAVSFNMIEDGSDKVSTMELVGAQPRPRPPEAMLLVGLTRNEVETQLKPLAGFDKRYPRNLLLREVAGSPFTDPQGATYRKYKIGVGGMDGAGLPHEAFPSIDVVTYTSDRKFFFSKAFTEAQPPPKVQERNYEEGLGVLVRPGDTYQISAISGATVTVTAPNPQPTTEPPIDFTREIVPGDMVTVKSEAYNVISVTAITGGAKITLDATPIGLTPGTDTLRAPNKNLEDYFIAKDRLGVLSSINRMEVLVADFVASVGAVPDDMTAPAMIEDLVNVDGPKILLRARLICSNANFAYADDRILYWARIKMMVMMKNHPYLRRVKKQKDTLVKLFESKSRGYDGVTFAAASSRKKVLIAGFDPFHIAENNMRSNPSGAAVLALHGQDHTLDGVSIHMQSAIFPNRYADFDGKDFDGTDFEGIQSKTGVVESFFEQFIDPAAPGVKPDLIVTLSQGGPLEFWVDRFASRTRGETDDNMCRSNIPFPSGVDGDPFYQTKLDATKMVLAGNKSADFKVFYNNVFWYMWADGAQLALYPIDLFQIDPSTSQFKRDLNGKLIPNDPPQPDSGALPVENTDHPEHNKLKRTKDPSGIPLAPLVPSALTETSFPTKSEITPGRGSGGQYFSNEIFYRVSRLREKHNSLIITGHFHIPQIQHDTAHNETWPKISAANTSVTTSKNFNADLLRRMILEIRDALVRAIS